MPSYSTFDPKGWCGDPKRGAAMGRPTVGEPGAVPEGRLTLRYMPLDSGGYDRNGTYFGHGAPLYWYAGVDTNGNEIDGMVRAWRREAAKDLVREIYPTATFYKHRNDHRLAGGH